MVWEAGKKFLMGQGVYYIMAGIGGLGVIFLMVRQFAGRAFYKRAKSPEKSKDGYIGQMCRDFEKQVRASGNVNNVNDFVSNYLSIHKFGIVPLISVDFICGQIVYLCLLCGILFGGLGYIWKLEAGRCINITLFGIGTFGVLFCIKKISNYENRLKNASLNLAVYLENEVMPGILMKDGAKNKPANNKQTQAKDKDESAKKREEIRARRSEKILEDVKNEKRSQDIENQAKMLIQMNAVREFTQRTLAEENAKKEALAETAASIIRPLEQESTRTTSQALTEKEEKIIADILKEYVK